jgi:hypothetical protein
MSTTYYTLPDKKPIGQTHALPVGQGYHMTWTMFPLDFCEFATHALYTPAVIDEHGNHLSMDIFTALMHRAASQSFEEGIE